MQKSKFLYLPIEVIPRELDAKLLIAAEACNNGFNVILGTKAMNSLLRELPEGIYFYKDSSYPMNDFFAKIQEFGYHIAVHDEEGLVNQSDEDYLNRRILFNTLTHVNTFFCWGTYQKKLISYAKSKFSTDLDIVVVGHPRFDLLQNPYKSYNTFTLKKQKKTILINTKLAECNHHNGENGWLDLLKSHNMLHSEQCLSLRLEQIEYKKKLLEKYIELIKILNDTFSNVEIIIRPHPSESIEVWEEHFLDKDNIKVTKKHNIGYWLNRCDLVIHTGCTTAIEAVAADIPVISFNPVYDERFEISLPNEVSNKSSTISDCIDLVANIIEEQAYGDIGKENVKLVLKQHVDNIENPISYAKIVDYLVSIDIGKFDISGWKIIKWKLIGYLSLIKSILMKREVDKTRDLDFKYVQKTLRSLCYVSNNKIPKMKKIKKNIFLLEKIK